MTSWPDLIARVARDARFPDSEYHGDSHWRAVAAAGRMLCDRDPRADRTAVLLFALVHDSMRQTDDEEPEHGRRAGAYLKSLIRDGLVVGCREDLGRLTFAIARHNDGMLSPDPTVGCCWDADRLNLWRVGTEPNPVLLCTPAARTVPVREWSMTLHDTAPAWDDVLANRFDPWTVGGRDDDWGWDDPDDAWIDDVPELPQGPGGWR